MVMSWVKSAACGWRQKAKPAPVWEALEQKYPGLTPRSEPLLKANQRHGCLWGWRGLCPMPPAWLQARGTAKPLPCWDGFFNWIVTNI